MQDAGIQPDLVATSMAALQRLFGVSRTTVKDWCNKGMPTRTENGTTVYPLPEIVQWWGARALERELRTNGDRSIQQLRALKLDSEIESNREKIRSQRYLNEEAEGKLVSAESVERDVAIMMVSIRTALLSVPDELTKLIPDEMKALTKQKCDAKVRAILTAAYTATIADTTPQESMAKELERVLED